MIVSKEIETAARLLTQGEVVSIPTETVYGLAADISNEQAIRSIFDVKGRPPSNPLIVHIHSSEQLDQVVRHVPQQAQQLIDKFWPGPLTLILEKKAEVSDLITAGLDTVGVRMPNHEATLELLSLLPFPLAAPSANPFGSVSPTKASHVEKYFKDDIPMVLDGGECQKGIESTIVGFENDQVIIYRLGSISVEAITSVIGEVMIKNQAKKAPNAPGMLSKHYSPNTKTILVDDVAKELAKYPDQKVGTLTFQQDISDSNVAVSLVLSSSGSFEEATRNLYQCLHDLDNSDLDVILVEKMPDHDLGRSINDRLARAAVR